MGWVWHQVWHLVWHTNPPRRGGRSRPYVSLREGSPARARAGRSATPIGPMRDALLRAFLVIGGISAACAWTWPGVFHEADPVAVLVRDHTPNVYAAVGRLVRRRARRGRVHCRPISHQPVADLVRPDGRQSRAPVPPSRVATFADGGRPGDRRRGGPSPGQSHREPDPEWLTIPERGLSPGVAMFGAVGSGKTSACLHPFARQLLSWHADTPAQRPAALVLEVKGDSCHDIRRMLTELDRGGDDLELSLDGRLTWNPLSATWRDSYSLASPVASRLNHLFGNGKEPFGQPA